MKTKNSILRSNAGTLSNFLEFVKILEAKLYILTTLTRDFIVKIFIRGTSAIPLNKRTSVYLNRLQLDIRKHCENRQKLYMLFAVREVRIGKNCARGLEYGPT